MRKGVARRNEVKHGASGYADKCDVSQLDMQRTIPVGEWCENANGNCGCQASAEDYSPACCQNGTVLP